MAVLKIWESRLIMDNMKNLLISWLSIHDGLDEAKITFQATVPSSPQQALVPPSCTSSKEKWPRGVGAPAATPAPLRPDPTRPDQRATVCNGQPASPAEKFAAEEKKIWPPPVLSLFEGIWAWEKHYYCFLCEWKKNNISLTFLALERIRGRKNFFSEVRPLFGPFCWNRPPASPLFSRPLFNRPLFSWPLFSYAAEKSASWQH